MTGYGKAEGPFRGHKMICEIRSLNSKTMEMNTRLTPALRARELDLRAIVAKRLERGKVDLAIFEDAGINTSASLSPINWNAAREYASQYLKEFNLTVVPNEIMASILRFPDVIRMQDESGELTEDEWQGVQELLNKALEAFDAFRIQEGKALQTMFTEKLDGIADLLAQVEPFEKSRVPKIKERLQQSLAQLSAETKAQIDQNRLEQEMIYYLEKLDITEEKVRLTNHIKYFRECMESEGSGVGKKLGFIAQEMGREINTLGSKSNQSEMQILVVKMKDILEQIKEQVLNVL